MTVRSRWSPPAYRIKLAWRRLSGDIKTRLRPRSTPGAMYYATLADLFTSLEEAQQAGRLKRSVRDPSPSILTIALPVGPRPSHPAVRRDCSPGVSQDGSRWTFRANNAVTAFLTRLSYVPGAIAEGPAFPRIDHVAVSDGRSDSCTLRSRSTSSSTR